MIDSKTCVADASVVAKWFFTEVHEEAASRLLSSTYTLHAPDFLVLEFGSIVAKRLRRDPQQAQQIITILDAFFTIPVQLHSWSTLFDGAFQLAVETRRSLYDCLYLALAEILGGELVTADRKFYDAVQHHPSARYIRWVEDL